VLRSVSRNSTIPLERYLPAVVKFATVNSTQSSGQRSAGGADELWTKPLQPALSEDNAGGLTAIELAYEIHNITQSRKKEHQGPSRN